MTFTSRRTVILAEVVNSNTDPEHAAPVPAAGAGDWALVGVLRPGSARDGG
jgi:hypothetical protein